MGEYRIPIKWSERNQIEEKKIEIDDDKQFEQKEQGTPANIDMLFCARIPYKNAPIIPSNKFISGPAEAI